VKKVEKNTDKYLCVPGRELEARSIDVLNSLFAWVQATLV